MHQPTPFCICKVTSPPNFQMEITFLGMAVDGTAGDGGTNDNGAVDVDKVGNGVND